MRLHFLDFDYSEDDEGTATWDAVACVPAERLPELEAEITSVLAWADEEFHTRRGPVELDGLWDYDLQCERAGAPLMALSYWPDGRPMLPPLQLKPGEQVTLTLSLSGAPAFAQAFTEYFDLN